MCAMLLDTVIYSFLCVNTSFYFSGIRVYRSELAESSYRARILNLSVALSISIEMIVRFFFFDHR